MDNMYFSKLPHNYEYYIFRFKGSQEYSLSIDELKPIFGIVRSHCRFSEGNIIIPQYKSDKKFVFDPHCKGKLAKSFRKLFLFRYIVDASLSLENIIVRDNTVIGLFERINKRSTGKFDKLSYKLFLNSSMEECLRDMIGRVSVLEFIKKLQDSYVPEWLIDIVHRKILDIL